jgi:hypothetical protein
MRRKPSLARVGRLLVVVLSLAPCGGAPRPANGQEPGRPEDPRLRQLQLERAIRVFTRESRQKISSARKNWREGRHADAVKELEECLELARKTLGEQPNAPRVDILKTLARVHESKGSFGASVADLKRALDVQMSLTGPRSWEVLELQSEVGRLERLGKLAADRLEVLSHLGPTAALVSTGQGTLASAICIDPGGLFLTRARPLANLWRSSTTHFDYDPKTGELIGLRTEHNREEPLALAVVVNPGLPDQAILLARVVRTSATEDLALLAVPASRPLAALELARGDVPEVGTEAIVLNHWNAPVQSRFDEAEPIFLRACPSTVTAVRSLNGRPWILQLDASLPPGGSEGLVLDCQGRLLGFAVQGLAGTGVSYTIPARAIEELLGKAVLLAEPPVLSYRERKRERDWKIPIWVAEPKSSGIEVEVALGEGRSRRSFRSTSIAERPGTFVVRVVPVDSKTVDHVDLLVAGSQGTTRYTVEDCEVSVGSTKLRLSELRRLDLGREPRGVAADGRLLAGAPGGLDGLKRQEGGTTVPVDLRDASSLRVVYPPELIEPLPGELIVRSRGEVLLRERFPVRLREPLVDLGGVLDVSQAPAMRDRGDDLSPVRLGEDRVVELDGKIGAVAVGGGGRYLLLTLPERRELVVFDAFSQRLVARVPLADDDVLVAAGADALFLVYPGLRIIHRWDLRRMALDRTAELPIRGHVKAVALGAGAAGPMLVRWVEEQSGGKFTRMDFSFIDPESLKVLACSTFREGSETGQRDQPGEAPEPGVLRLARYTNGSGDVRLSASPRGDVFALWQTDVSPVGFCTLALRGRAVRGFQRHSDFGHLIPGQDGRTVFTGRGERLDLEGQPRVRAGTPTAGPGIPLPPNQLQSAPPRLVPSAEPAYYLAINGLGTQLSPGAAGSKAVVAFHALGLDRPLGTLEVPWQVPGPVPPPPHDNQRFHWIPAADLLCVIPPSDDRLLLRRIRLDELLSRLGEDDLFVSSPRGVDVLLGRPFRHAIEARSGRGQPEFTLSKGPTGLRVTAGGELIWDEPIGKPGDQVEAVVELRDAAGHTITETMILRLLTAGRAIR